jgi:hypothetical protein
MALNTIGHEKQDEHTCKEFSNRGLAFAFSGVQIGGAMRHRVVWRGLDYIRNGFKSGKDGVFRLDVLI